MTMAPLQLQNQQGKSQQQAVSCSAMLAAQSLCQVSHLLHMLRSLVNIYVLRLALLVNS